MLAVAITLGVVSFLLWFVAILRWEPRTWVCYGSLLAWSVPLIYLGGMGSGMGFEETTYTVLGLALIGFFIILRITVEDAILIQAQKRDDERSLDQQPHPGTKQTRAPKN